MIDLKNEEVKELIESIKRMLEREILKCFDCKVNVLNVGEPKNGKYLINITYMTKDKAVNFPTKPDTIDFPQGVCITTNLEILEEDYKKWCKEVKEEE